MTGSPVPTRDASQAAVNRFLDMDLTSGEMRVLIARLCGSNPDAVQRCLDEAETDRIAGR